MVKGQVNEKTQETKQVMEVQKESR